MNIQLNIKNTEDNKSDFKPQIINISIAEGADENKEHSVQTTRTEIRESERNGCPNSIITHIDYFLFSSEVLASLLKTGVFPISLDEDGINNIIKQHGYEIHMP